MRLGLMVALMLSGCSTDPGPGGFNDLPVLDRTVALEAGGAPVVPERIELLDDVLYVAANRGSELHMFSAADFSHQGNLPLAAEATPGDFALADGAIIAADIDQGLLAVYDRAGTVRDGFGLMPDGITRLAPVAVTEFGGVLYAADRSTRRVLAVSLADAPGITEFGELILTVPPADRDPLGLPSSVRVTPDGRLLVGDEETGRVSVFTCDGRFVYDFDPVPGLDAMAPRALALDDCPDPSLVEEEIFDPSGVRGQGRVHVVDGLNGRIHIFNPLGRYVASYPPPGNRLSGPTDISVDRTRRRVILCDPPAGRLVVFRY